MMTRLFIKIASLALVLCAALCLSTAKELCEILKGEWLLVLFAECADDLHSLDQLALDMAQEHNFTVTSKSELSNDIYYTIKFNESASIDINKSNRLLYKIRSHPAVGELALHRQLTRRQSGGRVTPILPENCKVEDMDADVLESLDALKSHSVNKNNSRPIVLTRKWQLVLRYRGNDKDTDHLERDEIAKLIADELGFVLTKLMSDSTYIFNNYLLESEEIHDTEQEARESKLIEKIQQKQVVYLLHLIWPINSFNQDNSYQNIKADNFVNATIGNWKTCADQYKCKTEEYRDKWILMLHFAYMSDDDRVDELVEMLALRHNFIYYEIYLRDEDYIYSQFLIEFVQSYSTQEDIMQVMSHPALTELKRQHRFVRGVPGVTKRDRCRQRPMKPVPKREILFH